MTPPKHKHYGRKGREDKFTYVKKFHGILIKNKELNKLSNMQIVNTCSSNKYINIKFLFHLHKSCILVTYF